MGRSNITKPATIMHSWRIVTATWARLAGWVPKTGSREIGSVCAKANQTHRRVFFAHFFAYFLGSELHKETEKRGIIKAKK